MDDEERKILEDMKAFIDFALEKEFDFREVLLTLAHDCGGVIRNDKCFLPRSSGFTKIMEKRRSALKLALVVHDHRHGTDIFPCRTLTKFPEITNELINSLGGDGELEKDSEGAEYRELSPTEEWPLISDE